jgi:hypothetical protein
MTAADRQRYRQRQRDHIKILSFELVEADEFALLNSLITAGRLSEAVADDRAETAAAVAKLLDDWRNFVTRHGRDPCASATLRR